MKLCMDNGQVEGMGNRCINTINICVEKVMQVRESVDEGTDLDVI